MSSKVDFYNVEDLTQTIRSTIEQYEMKLHQYVTQDDEHANATLESDIELLTTIANGMVNRDTTSEEVLSQVRAALDRILDFYFKPMYGLRQPVPLEFWNETRIGQVCATAMRWLHRDQLISYSAAARLLYNDANSVKPQVLSERIRRLIQRDKLRAYIDPLEPNPRHAQRVLLNEVEQLRAQLRQSI